MAEMRLGGLEGLPGVQRFWALLQGRTPSFLCKGVLIVRPLPLSVGADGAFLGVGHSVYHLL